MPNVIRAVTRSTMIAQYLELCQEKSFEDLSQATLYRILEVREASQRKALKSLTSRRRTSEGRRKSSLDCKY